MKREPIQVREWQQNEPRFTDFVPDGPVPQRYEARIAELRRVFADAYAATHRMSTIPRVSSVTRCQVYDVPMSVGVQRRRVENLIYETHYYGPLAEIDGEDCASAVRVLGEAAGRWAETLAEAAGISLAEAVLQERLAPTVLDMAQRDWNLFLGWHARGAIMRAPIGAVVADLVEFAGICIAGEGAGEGEGVLFESVTTIDYEVK